MAYVDKVNRLIAADAASDLRLLRDVVIDDIDADPRYTLIVTHKHNLHKYIGRIKDCTTRELYSDALVERIAYRNEKSMKIFNVSRPVHPSLSMVRIFIEPAY